MKKLLSWIVAAMCPLLSFSQNPTMHVIHKLKQQKFPKTVPAGNYSGITGLGDGRYAVVSDKSGEDGFFVFQIEQDTLTGKILSVDNEGFRSSGKPNRDMEGIAYVPHARTLYISGEADNEILEYTLDGQHTGRRLDIPDIFRTANENAGFEALAYDAGQHLFWILTESMLKADGNPASGINRVKNRLRLQSFGDDLQPHNQYIYDMDEPQARHQGRLYAMGVSALCAADSGRLLVLEREAYVAKKTIGSWVHCKLYEVNPQAAAKGEPLQKHLLTEFRTKLNLIRQNFANYEGMCWGAELADGSRTLLLIADSQNQYKGILRDWLRVLIIK